MASALRQAVRNRTVATGRRPPHQSARPTILIVDDDADSRAMYSRYLLAMGCQVFTAHNGAVALEKANALWPDLIVMDLAMPILDGWTAIHRLKRSSWTHAIPIIALSAVELSRDRACAAGCDAFLAKPCLPEMLWWQVRSLLGIPVV